MRCGAALSQGWTSPTPLLEGPREGMTGRPDASIVGPAGLIAGVRYGQAVAIILTLSTLSFGEFAADAAGA
jgi:hypothetical protein